MRRIDDLLKEIESLDVDFFLITDPLNVQYLIGAPLLFDSNFNGAILVSQDVQILLIDFRYIEIAESAGLDIEIRNIEKSIVSEVAKISQKGIVTIEADHLTVSGFTRLKSVLGGRVEPKSGLVESLRMIKDESEIEKLKEAALIGDRVFERIIEEIEIGVAEIEIAARLEELLKEEGASKVSFDPIVASGPNSAIPHAGATERAFRSGDFIKLDFGCVFGGYYSDMTRTVTLGKASERQKEIYDLVGVAQAATLDGIKEGISGREADAMARDVFKKEDKAEHFGHNLGHGVGLQVHEKPTLGARSEDHLKAGQVFTVEPGLYFSGYGGVRIEDVVLLKEDGIEVLTHSSKELIEI